MTSRRQLQKRDDHKGQRYEAEPDRTDKNARGRGTAGPISSSCLCAFAVNVFSPCLCDQSFSAKIFPQ
jgi:hypothetical protein